MATRHVPGTVDAIVSCTAGAIAGAHWAPFRTEGVRALQLNEDPHSSAGLMRFEPGSHELPHSHDHGGHHVWILSGSLHVNGVDLPAGSYVYTPPGVPHSAVTTGEACTLFYVYVRDPGAAA